MSDSVKRRGDWWLETSNGRWMMWTGGAWEPKDTPPPPPRGRESFLGASKALGLPAFILAVVGLALTIKPSWISPTERGVIIGDTSITRGVTFNEYIHYPTVWPFIAESIRDQEMSFDIGVVVDFNYELRGFKRHDKLPLRWTLLDGQGEPLRQSEDEDRLFRVLDAIRFYAELRGSDSGSWGVWVQTDNLLPGRYFLRLEIYDPSGTNRLAYKNSQRFAVR